MPTVGAHVDLTQAPTFNCPTIGGRAQQQVQGHRTGSQEIGRVSQFDVGGNSLACWFSSSSVPKHGKVGVGQFFPDPGAVKRYYSLRTAVFVFPCN